MKFFRDQVGLSSFYSDLFYTVGAAAVILVVLAFGLVDAALVRTKNVLDTWVQKLLAALIAGLGTLLGGFGIWQWQFNSALGVRNPLGQALSDWWIGGRFQSSLSQSIDPRVLRTCCVLKDSIVALMSDWVLGSRPASGANSTPIRIRPSGNF